MKNQTEMVKSFREKAKSVSLSVIHETIKSPRKRDTRNKYLSPRKSPRKEFKKCENCGDYKTSNHVCKSESDVSL